MVTEGLDIDERVLRDLESYLADRWSAPSPVLEPLDVSRCLDFELRARAAFDQVNALPSNRQLRRNRRCASAVSKARSALRSLLAFGTPYGSTPHSRDVDYGIEIALVPSAEEATLGAVESVDEALLEAALVAVRVASETITQSLAPDVASQFRCHRHRRGHVLSPPGHHAATHPGCALAPPSQFTAPHEWALVGRLSA